jgi:hypothetical protein
MRAAGQACRESRRERGTSGDGGSRARTASAVPRGSIVPEGERALPALQVWLRAALTAGRAPGGVSHRSALGSGASIPSEPTHLHPRRRYPAWTAARAQRPGAS